MKPKNNIFGKDFWERTPSIFIPKSPDFNQDEILEKVISFYVKLILQEANPGMEISINFHSAATAVLKARGNSYGIKILENGHSMIVQENGSRTKFDLIAGIEHLHEVINQ